MKVALTLVIVTGCAGTSRGLDAYRTDTQRVLVSRNAQVTACYDKALEADPKATGTVTVQFVVEKKTGAFIHAALDPKHTSASPAVGACVLKAVDGLALQPADRNEGRATFVYELTRAPPAS